MKNVRLSRVLAPALSLVLLAACGGGSAPPPSDPHDPPLEGDEAGGSSAAAAAPSAKVKEGMDAIQAGDFAKAKTILQAAVSESPKDPQAVFYFGVALEGSGDGKGAIEQYKKALSLDPKLTEASANLSGALLDQGDAAGALAAADHGLKSAPKSPDLLRNKAAALDAAGSKDAPGAFRAAMAASPKDESLRYLYAESLARTGDSAKALTELEGLAGSEDIAVLASAARLLGKLKAFDKCISVLDRAIGKQKAAELFVDRGLCRHGGKDDKGARGDFEAAIKVDAKFAPAHYYLGQQLRGSGDTKGAKAELQKAADLDANGALGAAAKKQLDELK